VDQYFNDSTGVGDRGEQDFRGPWNQGGDWEFVNAPAFQQLESELAGTRTPNGDSNDEREMTSVGSSRESKSGSSTSKTRNGGTRKKS